MTLLFIVVIAAVAGSVVWIYEKRQIEEVDRNLQNYILGVLHDESLSKNIKISNIVEAFSQNGYKVDSIGDETVTASRKYFSIGAALLWFSFGGIGFLVYLIYFFLKKPKVLKVDITKSIIE